MKLPVNKTIITATDTGPGKNEDIAKYIPIDDNRL